MTFICSKKKNVFAPNDPNLIKVISDLETQIMLSEYNNEWLISNLAVKIYAVFDTYILKCVYRSYGKMSE